MPRDIDIDALLGEGALRITLGGQTYEVPDVPLSTMLRIQQRQTEGMMDPRELIKELLPSLNGDVLDGIGAKAAGIVLREITDFFSEATREAQMEAMPSAPTGPEVPPASSETTPPTS